MAYPGHRGKITLGTVTAAFLNMWENPGIVNQLIEKDLYGREFQNYEYGLTDGGTIEVAGYFHTGTTDPVEEIDAAQELLRGYAESKASVPNLRLYFGTGGTEFFRATPGALVLVENYKAGAVDKTTGLVPISFRLRVSDGYMCRIAGYYAGTDLTFAPATGKDNDTITKKTGTAFAGLGFLAGQTVAVEGSTLNDGAYTLYNVANNVLTLTEETTALRPEPEGAAVSLISYPIYL